MNTQTIEKFSIIGIAVRTTNQNGQAAIDIPALWAKFMGDRIMEKITNKLDDQIYCLYTEYEKDHTRPYTTILGCKVADLENVPAEMVGLEIKTTAYQKFTAKGNLTQGAVFNEWTKIWNSHIPRAFTADFEIYGERAQKPEDAEVDIFIALK